ETDALIKEILAEHSAQGNGDIKAVPVVVNESGASVYSASELASQELQELDVSIRGAVSIARRLQDPLSELVKVDPKAIGVGQYQHDVNQTQLADSLTKVTQDCVNAVGVDVNTASPAIFSYIAGLNVNVAQQIVNYRNEHGA
ncbi:helix-hairpin-helix domain-containing protein, partial [Streptomyces sp. DSM 41014]